MDLIIASVVCLMVIKSRIIKNSGPNIFGLKTPVVLSRFGKHPSKTHQRF